MAWSAATQAQHGRAHDDRQDDLTDAALALIAPLNRRSNKAPPVGRAGSPAGLHTSRLARLRPLSGPPEKALVLCGDEKEQDRDDTGALRQVEAMEIVLPEPGLTPVYWMGEVQRPRLC